MGLGDEVPDLALQADICDEALFGLGIDARQIAGVGAPFGLPSVTSKKETKS